jgi:hypothetical protein
MPSFKGSFLLANDADMPLPNDRAGVTRTKTLSEHIVCAILLVPITPALSIYVHNYCEALLVYVYVLFCQFILIWIVSLDQKIFTHTHTHTLLVQSLRLEGTQALSIMYVRHV